MTSEMLKLLKDMEEEEQEVPEEVNVEREKMAAKAPRRKRSEGSIIIEYAVNSIYNNLCTCTLYVIICMAE